MLLHEISLCHAGWINISMHITQRHHGGEVTQLEYTPRVSNMPSAFISLPQSQMLALQEGASTKTMLKSNFCLLLKYESVTSRFIRSVLGHWKKRRRADRGHADRNANSSVQPGRFIHHIVRISLGQRKKGKVWPRGISAEMFSSPQ